VNLFYINSVACDVRSKMRALSEYVSIKKSTEFDGHAGHVVPVRGSALRPPGPRPGPSISPRCSKSLAPVPGSLHSGLPVTLNSTTSTIPEISWAGN